MPAFRPVDVVLLVVLLGMWGTVAVMVMQGVELNKQMKACNCSAAYAFSQKCPGVPIPIGREVNVSWGNLTYG